MTSTQLGKANQDRTHKWLEDHGFVVHSVKATSPSFKIENGKYTPLFKKKGHSQDLFNLFDHVAVYERKVAGELRYVMGRWFYAGDVIFVQTKSGKTIHDMDFYRNFPAFHKYLFAWTKGEDKRYHLSIKKVADGRTNEKWIDV